MSVGAPFRQYLPLLCLNQILFLFQIGEKKVTILKNKDCFEKGVTVLSQPSFDVWIDEERQIIRQRMHRDLDLADFEQLIEATGACVRKLRNQSGVRILVDGEWHGRMKGPVRALALDTLRSKSIGRMAMVNGSAFVRVFIRFIQTATGIDRMRVFREEGEALHWLLA